MPSTFEQLLSLMKLSNQFALVQRAIYKYGTDRMENDVEHSYQLAFLGWQLNDMLHLGLDNTRIMQYALAHDLVEVYEGDTDAMGTTGDPTTKVAREENALKRLHEEYAQFGSFVNSLEQYEKREDEESRFVYALDKLIPTMNIYLDGGRDFKRKGKSLADIRAYKDSKIAVYPEIEKIYKDLISHIESNYEEYFGKQN